MQLQLRHPVTNQTSQATQLQSLVNSLPAAPGRIRTADLARKLRRHPAWRDAAGNLSDVKYFAKIIVI